VLSNHQQKIDLHQEYPCPCHRQGRLKEITLTEAFGCSRCQKIFVLQENGYTIEELSTTYPYKYCYFWNGSRWQIVRSHKRDLIWTLFVVSLLPFAIVFFPLQLGAGAIVQVLLTTIAILVLIVTILWLISQR
jgi:hypothetical protein